MDRLSIAVVERETGLSKDTLRVWERRYGFPSPERDAAGDRAYRAEDLHALRLLRRLTDAGHRPAKIVGLPAEQLETLARSGQASAPADTPAVAADAALILLQHWDFAGLRDHLAQRLAQAGLVGFVCDQLAPLTIAVGEAWARGDIGVAQEHLFTEVVTRLLRAHLQPLPGGRREGAAVLFATLPGEQHGLGLLMAECLVTVAGGHAAISLGTEVPMQELVKACEAHRCQIVALSFSQACSSAFVGEGVRTLRALLPPTVALWIGGRGAATLKRTVDGVTVFSDLGQLQAALDAANASASES